MDGRESLDEFGRLLAVARERLLANLADPWHAVEAFEPILEELRDKAAGREEKSARIRKFGDQLSAEIRSVGRPVSMEVRHYCLQLRHLDDPSGSLFTSLTDLQMVTLTRFAHYEGHQSDRCSVCRAFPGDLPFQGSPGGRAHFHEWLKQTGG